MKNNLADRIAKLTPEQRALFEAQLKAKNLAEKVIPKAQEGVIPRRGHNNPSPLSVDQERLWFFHQMNPDKPTYNVYGAIRLKGKLNIDAMEHAVNEIIRRHEAWRTTFDLVDGQPVQIVHPELHLKFDIADVRDFPEAEREAVAQQKVLDEVMIPIDLVNGPLVRVKLVQVSEEANIIVLTVHHIVTDRVTFSIVFQELVMHYIAFLKNQPSLLPEPAIQYADYAEWQRNHLQGEERERLLSYWKNYLAGSDFVLNLPTDFPRPAVQTFRGARHFFDIPKSLGDRLKGLGTQEGATAFMVLMAAFKVLLYRYSGQEDIIIGTPLANRDKSEMERTVGYFLTSGVFRTQVEGRLSFRQLLARVRENSLGAFQHQGMPFGMLLDELKPKRDLSRNPIFQAMFVYVDVPEEPMKFPELDISYDLIDGETAKYDIVLGLVDRDGIVDRDTFTESFLEYSPDLFRPETIALMAEHWLNLVEAVIAQPDTPIAELPMLTPEEQQKLILEWNSTQAPFSQDLCAIDLFEQQAARTPDAAALDFEGGTYTYREVDERANRIANYLQEQGVGPERIVGLCFDRSPDYYIGLLGVQKAGGAFLPLDPVHPNERIAFMLEDSEAPLVLTQAALKERVAELAPQAQVIALDAEWDTFAGRNAEKPVRTLQPNNLAYVIYTSGSTGKPKGVLVEHRGLVNLLEGWLPISGAGVGERYLQFASISFDASVLDIYAVLLSGTTMVIASREATAPGASLVRTLQERNVTMILMTPSLLALLPAEALPNIRTVVSAGEACTTEVVAKWAPNRRFINVYGPTEATVQSHIAVLTSTSDYVGTPPIGRLLPNMTAYVLDAFGQPVPVGVPGELHIGGAGVARGYLKRPELTEEKFIADRFSNQPGARLYKTGDLVRFLPDGQLEFLGRTDFQVKVRGYRIELGEVETRLTEHPQVKQAVAVAMADAGGSNRLIAYVVREAAVPTVTELRTYLKDRLPEYMVPSVIVLLDALPLNASGKVDRRALPAPDGAMEQEDALYAAPRNVVEEVLAKIWGELLELNRVGVHSHFFDLGGHSLLATQMISRVRDTFQVDVPMDKFFTVGTIADIADVMTRYEKVPGQVEKIARVRKKLDSMSEDQVRALLAAKSEEKRG